MVNSTRSFFLLEKSAGSRIVVNFSLSPTLCYYELAKLSLLLLTKRGEDDTDFRVEIAKVNMLRFSRSVAL